MPDGLRLRRLIFFVLTSIVTLQNLFFYFNSPIEIYQIICYNRNNTTSFGKMGGMRIAACTDAAVSDHRHCARNPVRADFPRNRQSASSVYCLEAVLRHRHCGRTPKHRDAPDRFLSRQPPDTAYRRVPDRAVGQPLSQAGNADPICHRARILGSRQSPDKRRIRSRSGRKYSALSGIPQPFTAASFP